MEIKTIGREISFFFWVAFKRVGEVLRNFLFLKWEKAVVYKLLLIYLLFKI